MYLSSGSKLETYTILKIHCSILTSQSLLSKLGKLMERSIHQVQYISYSVDYSTAALEGNNSRLSKLPQQARQSFSPLAWHTRCTLSQASFQWHRCTYEHTLRSSQKQMKTSYGIVVSWELALTGTCKMQHSLW